MDGFIQVIKIYAQTVAQKEKTGGFPNLPHHVKIKIMIQPNEKLLPGNVVMWRNRFYTLTKGDIYSMDYLRNFYSPIPLTTEILVQWCGFTKGFYAYGAIMGKCNVSIDFEDGFLAIVDSNGSAVNVKLPEHLHTLQNTVYFISGEEMPVNIPNN